MASDAKGQTEATLERIMRTQRGLRSRETENHVPYQTDSNQHREQVRRELQETTIQYLSVADPVEAAARKHRVLASEAEGLIERTVSSIIAAAAEQRRPLSPWERGIRSESPPAIDFNTAMQASDVELTPPPRNTTLENDLREEIRPSPNKATPPRLKSIIVSPEPENEEDQIPILAPLQAEKEKETLVNAQSKEKKKNSKPSKKLSPRLTPNILRGASSKKRKLSHIQHSPGNGSKWGVGAPSRPQLMSQLSIGGGSQGLEAPVPANPAIQLIPAMSKERQRSQGTTTQQMIPGQPKTTSGPSQRRTTNLADKAAPVQSKKQDFRSDQKQIP